jgi:hypothetical protein
MPPAFGDVDIAGRFCYRQAVLRRLRRQNKLVCSQQWRLRICCDRPIAPGSGLEPEANDNPIEE